MMKYFLSTAERSRVIEMAWGDRTPFEAILEQYGLTECDVISLMKSALKQSIFKNWRKYVSGRKTKRYE